MDAIKKGNEFMTDLELVEEMNKVSGVSIPNAIKELKDAKVLHTRVCNMDKMQETVENILGIR